MAVLSIPQLLLSMYHEDSRKPSILYFYQNLQVDYEDCDVIRSLVASGNFSYFKEFDTLAGSKVRRSRANVENLLTGCDPSDVCALAYLHCKLGVTSQSVSFLVHAFPTTLSCDLEVSWEMLTGTGRQQSQGGGSSVIRSSFKDERLCFLRRRLQIGPKEIYAMIKTHSRLSTYNVQGNMEPTLNAIQSSLFMTSREIRQVLLRMPSLLGISLHSLEARMCFFQDEAGMSISDLKEALLKQPSLLQYSIQSNLRPKLDFFTKELQISPHRISSTSSYSTVKKAAPCVKTRRLC